MEDDAFAFALHVRNCPAFFNCLRYSRADIGLKGPPGFVRLFTKVPVCLGAAHIEAIDGQKRQSSPSKKLKTMIMAAT